MTGRVEQRLCGGTFLMLLLKARKQRLSAREHYRGESDNLTDKDIAVGLIRIVRPHYEEPKKHTLKSDVADYKLCKKNGSAILPFGDDEFKSEFQWLMGENYQAVLERMAIFVSKMLETNTESRKDEKLVRALIGLIEIDGSIADDTLFNALESGAAISKTQLLAMEEYCFEALLLGVYHYAVCKAGENTRGKQTVDHWSPSRGGGKREYTGELWSDEGRMFQLTHCEAELAEALDDESPTAEVVNPVVFEAPEAGGVEQNVNNPIVMNFHGSVGVVKTNTGTITNNYYGGERDD